MHWVKSTALKTDPDLAGLFPIADQDLAAITESMRERGYGPGGGGVTAPEQRKFWWCVGFYNAQHPEQRKGQATFNVCMMLRPDLSEQIRATKLDAFHLDDRLDAMCQFIDDHWEDAP